MIKLAKLPVFKLPISLLFPKIAAGMVVKASSAFVLSNPYLIAFKRLGLKSSNFFNLSVVKANTTPLSAKTLRFVGA